MAEAAVSLVRQRNRDLTKANAARSARKLAKIDFITKVYNRWPGATSRAVDRVLRRVFGSGLVSKDHQLARTASFKDMGLKLVGMRVEASDGSAIPMVRQIRLDTIRDALPAGFTVRKGPPSKTRHGGRRQTRGPARESSGALPPAPKKALAKVVNYMLLCDLETLTLSRKNGVLAVTGVKVTTKVQVQREDVKLKL